jgi:hypothetical protein
MLFISRLIHKICRLGTLPGYLKFKKATRSVENTQRVILKDLLGLSEKTVFGKKYSLNAAMSYETFSGKVPLSTYPDWAELIDLQRNKGVNAVSGMKCDRYQPTSGSTSGMKWIPYTKKLLNEFNSCVNPWIHDLYKFEKEIGKGKHYWSLTWIPTDLRLKINANVSNDLELLPWWKKLWGQISMAVPDQVSQAPSSDASMFATVSYLAAEKQLTFLSMWSPTFALNQLEYISNKRLELADVLRTGSWGRRESDLSFIKCPKSKRAANLLSAWDGKVDNDFFRKLWPHLALIGAWDTSTSKPWSDKLRMMFKGSKFQGKALWTTEGVVTIPFEGKYPLAVASHFYEFFDFETEKIHPSWNLKKGQILRPLLTTGSGFFRYALSDRVKVVDFIGECPCLEFLGRMEGIDLVGEKLSPEVSQDIINIITQKYGILPITLYAVLPDIGEKPFYMLLCEGENHPALNAAISIEVENLLRKHFHYNVARDLNQLSPARCLVSPEAKQISEFRGLKKGMIIGNMKVEPLTLWDCEIHDEVKAIM